MRLAAHVLAFAFATLAALGCVVPAEAAHAAAGIEVLRAAAAPSLAGARSGTAQLTLRNTGSVADRLVLAASPAANSVELHRMVMNGDVMTMRRVDRLTIAAGQTVRIEEDAGLHVMLLGLKQALKAGDKVALTLTFEKAGRVDTVLKVEPESASHR